MNAQHCAVQGILEAVASGSKKAPSVIVDAVSQSGSKKVPVVPDAVPAINPKVAPSTAGVDKDFNLFLATLEKSMMHPDDPASKQFLAEFVKKFGKDYNPFMKKMTSTMYASAMKDPVSAQAEQQMAARENFLKKLGETAKAAKESRAFSRARFMKANGATIREAMNDPLKKESFNNIVIALKQMFYNGFSTKQMAELYGEYLKRALRQLIRRPLQPIEQNQLDQMATKAVKDMPSVADMPEAELAKLRKHRLFSPVKFPSKLTIGGREYVLTKKVGSGDFARTFEAHVPGNPEQKLIVKVIRPGEENTKFFDMEVKALEKLNRLVAQDVENKVIVQPKIEGRLLKDILATERDPAKIAQLKAQYDTVDKAFMEKTGMIHGDVAPRNIIVEPNGQMTLIDLGLTRTLRTTPAEALQNSKPGNEVEWIAATTPGKLSSAFKAPRAPGSEQTILEEIARLQAKESKLQARLMSDFYRIVYRREPVVPVTAKEIPAAQNAPKAAPPPRAATAPETIPQPVAPKAAAPENAAGPSSDPVLPKQPVDVTSAGSKPPTIAPTEKRIAPAGYGKGKTFKINNQVYESTGFEARYGSNTLGPAIEVRSVANPEQILSYKPINAGASTKAINEEVGFLASNRKLISYNERDRFILSLPF